VIIVRTVVIALLCLDSLARVVPAVPFGVRAQQLAFPLSLLISGSAASTLAVPAWYAYRAERLAVEPLKPFIESMASATGKTQPVVLLQADVLERLSPYLASQRIHLFPNSQGKAWAVENEWLATTLAQDNLAWLVFDNGVFEGEYRQLYDSVSDWFDSRGCLVEQHEYGTVRVERFVLASTLPPLSVGARFQNGPSLISIRPPPESVRPGKALCMKIGWRAARPLQLNYKVFVHILSEDGQLVAQSDVQPSPPTSQWSESASITTIHGLILPADLAPGTYFVQAGLYLEADGSRLRLIDGSDSLSLTRVIVGTLSPDPP
jgi:hypothetical protein